MNNSDSTIIYNWSVDNNITRQKVKNMMLEAWRRVHMFQKGNSGANLLVLALPSQMKGLEDYFTPSSSLTPRVYNWFKLTSKGQEIVNKLSSQLTFSEKRHNLGIFNLVA